MAVQFSVSWPAREDEGEISPIRGQAEVITTTPKLKQMENGAQHVSTSTVGFVSLGHVFSCSTGLEECQTFEFCCFNKTQCGSALLRRTAAIWRSGRAFFLLRKVNKSAFQKQTFTHLRSALIPEDNIDIEHTDIQTNVHLKHRSKYNF